MLKIREKKTKLWRGIQIKQNGGRGTGKSDMHDKWGEGKMSHCIYVLGGGCVGLGPGLGPGPGPDPDPGPGLGPGTGTGLGPGPGPGPGPRFRLFMILCNLFSDKFLKVTFFISFLSIILPRLSYS